MRDIVTSIWITREGLVKVTITCDEGIGNLHEQTIQKLEAEFTNTWLNEKVEVKKE